MRVLFLEIDTESSWAVASLGPAFLASYLRKFGHEPVFLRVPIDWNASDVAERVEAIDPELIGVSLTTRQWLRARRLMADLRARVNVPVVAGGLHPTFSPDVVLKADGFDYVCRGEGETAMLDLVEAVARGDQPGSVQIPNIWGRGGSPSALLRPNAASMLGRRSLTEIH